MGAGSEAERAAPMSLSRPARSVLVVALLLALPLTTASGRGPRMPTWEYKG